MVPIPAQELRLAKRGLDIYFKELNQGPRPPSGGLSLRDTNLMLRQTLSKQRVRPGIMQVHRKVGGWQG